MYMWDYCQEQQIFLTSRHILWDSHRHIGLWKKKKDLSSSKRRTHLDLLLQCSHWESLDHGPGWLRLHLHLLAEGHPHTGLGGWLHSGLDAAEPGMVDTPVFFTS